MTLAPPINIAHKIGAFYIYKNPRSFIYKEKFPQYREVICVKNKLQNNNLAKVCEDFLMNYF